MAAAINNKQPPTEYRLVLLELFKRAATTDYWLVPVSGHSPEGASYRRVADCNYKPPAKLLSAPLLK